MSDAVGPLEYAEDRTQSYLGYSMQPRVRTMSNETAQLIDGEIKKLVEGGLNQAPSQVLTDHIDELHGLANGAARI
jgi:cell division protease FtsH